MLRWRLAGDGTAEFLDGRGDRDDTAEPAHDVTWTEATREDHVLGRHPHVRTVGGLYVSCVGGALVLKTADDTETAEGILSEPVDEPLQSLADADVAHARVGPLVLLRVRPYKEETDRYYVFNSTTEHAVRLDGIGDACRRLPGDEGIVFPGGYCLATGTVRTFDAADTSGLAFERTVRSPNGEDVLYAFRDRARGRALLLSYNVIRKEVAPPLGCRGHALFDDGTLVVLREREDEEPARVHPVQLWHTPYTSDTHAAAHPPAAGGPLARIGNADLVGGISACLGVVRAVEDTPPARPCTAPWPSPASGSPTGTTGWPPGTAAACTSRWPRCGTPPAGRWTSSRPSPRSGGGPPRRWRRRRSTPPPWCAGCAASPRPVPASGSPG